MDDKKILEIMKNHEPKPIGQHKKYSVLIPLIEVNGEDHVLFEVRSRHITQPGETSFPGGKVEPGETAETACIRETFEELNINFNNIEVFGETNFIINEGQTIHCFIGRLHNTSVEEIKHNNEVERVFTVPLNYFMEHRPTFYKITSNHFTEDFPTHLVNSHTDYSSQKSKRAIPFYNIPGEVLWGFTAQFIYDFSKLIKD